MNYQTIEIEIKDKVGTVFFNRQKVHNAFNEVMILELIKVVEELNQMKEAFDLVKNWVKKYSDLKES